MTDHPGGDGPGVGSVRDHMNGKIKVGERIGWDNCAKHLADKLNGKDRQIANQIQTIRKMEVENERLRGLVAEHAEMETTRPASVPAGSNGASNGSTRR